MGETHIGYEKKTGMPMFLTDGQHTLIDDFLGNSPTAKIWGELWCWKELDWTISDIARSAGISRTSLYKVWHFFTDYDVVIPSRVIKGIQYYKLNKRNYVAMKMMKLLSEYMHDKIEIGCAMDEAKQKLYKRHRKK